MDSSVYNVLRLDPWWKSGFVERLYEGAKVDKVSCWDVSMWVLCTGCERRAPKDLHTTIQQTPGPNRIASAYSEAP